MSLVQWDSFSAHSKDSGVQISWTKIDVNVCTQISLLFRYSCLICSVIMDRNFDYVQHLLLLGLILSWPTAWYAQWKCFFLSVNKVTFMFALYMLRSSVQSTRLNSGLILIIKLIYFVVQSWISCTPVKVMLLKWKSVYRTFPSISKQHKRTASSPLA